MRLLYLYHVGYYNTMIFYNIKLSVCVCNNAMVVLYYNTIQKNLYSWSFIMRKVISEIETVSARFSKLKLSTGLWITLPLQRGKGVASLPLGLN